MTTQRRMGVEGAKNRDLLVEAAAHILVEEGYAAVSARRVAEKAGLKVPLVYYYFKTMDELVQAVVRRNSARRAERLEQAMTSSAPLRRLWELNSDPRAAITTSELLALANHKEAIRHEVVTAAREFRSFQIQLVQQIMAERGIDTSRNPPGAIVTLIAALGRAMAQDQALGVEEGYNEATTLLEQALKLLGEPGQENAPG